MNRSFDATRAACAALTLALLIPALPARGVIRPKGDSPLEQKAFRHPDLYIRQQGIPISALPPALAAKAAVDLQALGGQSGAYDPRSGRWSLLVMSRPLVSASDVSEQAARAAVLGYVTQFQAQLGILPNEVGEPRVTVFDGGRVVQFHAQRVVNGVPVRDGWLKAALNSGNIVLLGTQNWGTIAPSTVPVFSREDAFGRVKSHAGVDALTLRSSKLELVAFEKGDDPNQVVIGDGATYRLVWAVSVAARGDNGTWEGLVDAHTGELLAFLDVNQYARKVTGGVFPVSNDGIAPDGVEVPGFPMPYAYMLGTNLTTNSSGVVTGIGSEVRTNLSGPYVRMNDNCGLANEVAMCTDLDLGTSGGTDCAVPAGSHSAGDTHASRSGFYEVNRQIEGWRNRLPDGHAAQPWLNSQLTSNMNIPESCNAFWNGSSINFYQSSAACRNTGEIAAVFDHEWGHGLDNNDTDPSISSPGEAIADIYGILRLTDSCFARGFFTSGTCGGYGNPCTTCSGIREVDYAKHTCPKPYDITWINQVGYPVATPCTPATTAGGCVGFASGQVGPCGQETHCEGTVPGQAVYDLFARDLAAAPFGLDFNTRLEITTRLVAVAAGNLANWYTCTQGAGGCATITGYNMFLAADDNDGNLANGTPHMTAIFNAFNRHGMACPDPTPKDGGCGGGPTTAPTLSATPGPNSASLSWSSVGGAARYEIYRTEGVKGCDFGKTKIGETTGTTFVDTGLRDGFPQLYSVLPVGSNGACVGRMAACQTVTPTAPAVEIDIAISEVANSLAIQGGDGDVFLDNCEQASLTFKIENAGDIPLTDVRITAVQLVGKPASDIITPLPLAVASTIPPGCPAAQPLQATVAFRPQGLTFDETLEVRISVMADELTSPRTATVFISGPESSFQFMESKTFNFETDFEGWKIVSGTYTRQAPGSPPSPVAALYSSSGKDGQCDNIRSPEVRLTASSTLSLQNQFSTEPETPLGTYDRANVGLFSVASGARTTIVPTGGRLYSYPPGTTGGTCVTENQAGWATTPLNPGVPFMSSAWSSAALGLPANAGARLRLDVAYGTDPIAAGAGFQFDEVTVTDFDLQVADTNSNTCAPLPPPARPDLRVTSISVNNNKSVREGDKVTILATVSNTGNASAPASTTEFRLDNTTILGSVATMAIPAGGSQQVSVQWDTRSQKGQHTIRATADAGIPPTVAESNENNNSSTLTVNVQGNKVKNQSFEQGNSSGTGPEGWSGESTGAGNASWTEGGSDGDKSAGASGNGGNAGASGSPSWTSDPIAVVPGEVLTLAVSVESTGASSAASAGLVYLGAAGQVLNSVTLLTAPLTVSGFTKLEQLVTIPAGVAQVRVKLVGFTPTDLRTAGTVRFDEAGLFGD